jgi:hypothetical protein
MLGAVLPVCRCRPTAAAPPAPRTVLQICTPAPSISFVPWTILATCTTHGGPGQGQAHGVSMAAGRRLGRAGTEEGPVAHDYWEHGNVPGSTARMPPMPMRLPSARRGAEAERATQRTMQWRIGLGWGVCRLMPARITHRPQLPRRGGHGYLKLAKFECGDEE